jgi:hypothetical protein
MSFRLRFGALTVARASDSAAVIQFDGANYNVYRDLLDDGSSHAVDFADGQLAADARTRWHFVSWSDGGPQSHTYVGSLAGGPLTANVMRDFKLVVTGTPGGTIAADTTGINFAGDFIPEGRPVKLTPTPDAGLRFCGWSGPDTTSRDSVLTLPMARPFAVTGSFGTSPTITSATARRSGVMGAAYADTLRIGGGGVPTWTVTGGALPPGITLAASGELAGFPQQTGNYSFVAHVVACDTASKAFTLSVTAPTLATADVVAQLLGPTAPLTPDQIRYLDFLGNNNNGFDIGDFLAWVKATNAPLSAAVLEALQRKGGRP